VIVVTAVVMNLFKIVDILLIIYKLIFSCESLHETYLKSDLPTVRPSGQASKQASKQPTDKLTN